MQEPTDGPWLVGRDVGPLAEQRGELVARRDYLEVSTGPVTLVEILDRESFRAAESLGGELVGLLIPADAVAGVAVAPAGTEFERVVSAPGVGVEEVLVADVEGASWLVANGVLLAGA